MASNPNPERAEEVMEWQSSDRRDRRAQSQPPHSESDAATTIALSHAPRLSPVIPHGFMARQRARTPEVTLNPLMRIRIRRINTILGRFDPKLTESLDAQHLAFSTLPAEVLHIAHELQRVKDQLAKGVTIVGQELIRVDEQMARLDTESQLVQEEVAARIAERLEAADSRQLRHEEVTMSLHAAVQEEGIQSRQRDVMLDQEIIRIQKQHKDELAEQEENINLLREALEAQLDDQAAWDNELADLKALVRSLSGQVKGKGRVPDTVPEATGGGNGGKKPPPKMRGAAGGAPGGGDDDGEDDDDDEGAHRGGKRPGGPSRRKKTPPPDDDDDDNGTRDLQLDLFVKAMAKALGKTTRVPVEPPPTFKNDGHQDVQMWLVACTDFFEANPWLWGSEPKRVRYALSKMDGPAVAPFALTYRKKMTRTMGFVKVEGYEFWHTFAELAIEQFGPTHEAEKALRKMATVKYHGDIAKFLLEMENLNIHTKVSGVA